MNNEQEKVESVGEDVKKLEFSSLADGNVKWYSCWGKELGSSLRELKMYIHTETCPQMFTAALFILTTGKGENNPKCP